MEMEIFKISAYIEHYDDYNQVIEVGVTEGIVCPNCGAFAGQKWSFGLGTHRHLPKSFSGDQDDLDKYKVMIRAKCESCHQYSYWLKKRPTGEETLLLPKTGKGVDLPNNDMSEAVKKIYNEAALILSDSPRASSALARLAIDTLTSEIGHPKDSLNTRIGKLVKEKNLSPIIQQSLDIVRVTGNNAIHPGNIESTDNEQIARELLKLINLIANALITEPNKVNKLFESLSESHKNSISKRDNY